MKESFVRLIHRKGESNKVQNEEEKSLHGEEMNANVCKRVVGNQNGDKEAVISELNTEEMNNMNGVKVDGSATAPISGETQGYPKELNDGFGVVNMEEMTAQLENAQKNEKVMNEPDIKDVNTEESLEVAASNMAGGVSAALEDQTNVEKPLDNQQKEKGANNLNPEVTKGTILDNERKNFRRENDVVGVVNMEEMTAQVGNVQKNEKAMNEPDIKDVNTKESLEVAASNMTGGGSPAPEDQTNVEKLLDNQQNEKVASDLNPEVTEGSILDNERKNFRRENDGVGVVNMEEMTAQVGNAQKNEKVMNEPYIKDVNTEESLEVAASNMSGGGSAAPEDQTNLEKPLDNQPNEKGANELNPEVTVGTILDNERKFFWREGPSSDAKEAPNNAHLTKKRRLIRKVFEDKGLGNTGASMIEVKPHFLIGNESDASDRVKNDENAEAKPLVEVCRTAPSNVHLTKKWRLNRKVFEDKGLGNTGSSMIEVNPDFLKGNEAYETDCVQNDKNAEAKPLVEVRRIMKRVRNKTGFKGHGGTDATNNEGKSKPTNDESENTDNKRADKQNLKKEDTAKSGDVVCPLQWYDEEKFKKVHTIKAAAKRIKSSNRVDMMGMIFMCSSETKEDCYHYKVFGLPAAKNDIVSMISKGMRLFLFDFELKLMYGIYEAAGPGGYNIEPRVFRSQFPSQVRFTVLEDCVPLAEKQFRSVIKDNYYTQNKFNCQLTSEQVRNLCKLFHESTKRANSKLLRRSRITGSHSSIQKRRKRKDIEDSQRGGSISPFEEEGSFGFSEEGMSGDPGIVNERFHHHPFDYGCSDIYEGETYSQSAAQSPLYQPFLAQNTLHTASYAYGAAPTLDVYRRDITPELHEQHLCRCRYDCTVELDYRDPYASYLEDMAYPEPAYETIVRYAYREPAYERGLSQEYYDCSFDTHQVEYKHAEDHLPLPPGNGY